MIGNVQQIHPIQEKILALQQIRPLASLSYREIGRQICSEDSQSRIHPQVVKYHLERLIDAGLLDNAHRPTTVSPQLLAKATDKPILLRIPMMGAVNAGPASMLADELPKAYVRLTSQLLRSKNHRDLIALRVSGNSMNRAQMYGALIEHGDYVIVDRSKRTPRNREIVVTNIDDRVNVKRIVFDYEHGQISLVSESSEHFDPIFLSARDNIDAFVEGTVVQVIKMEPAAETSGDVGATNRLL